jgi:hypothetical protein
MGGMVHQRWGNVAEGVDNNVGRFHQKCQNFRHHVRNFLWPNLRIVLEKKILPEKKNKSRNFFYFRKNNDTSGNVFSVISAKHQCCSATFHLPTSGTASALQHQRHYLATKPPSNVCV